MTASRTARRTATRPASRPVRRGPVDQWADLRRFVWGVLTLLSLGVAGYALAIVASGFELLPDEVETNGLPLGVRIHIVTAAFALLLGPWQFVRSLRGRSWATHRWIGRGYVVACLAGGVSGAVVAVSMSSGPVAAAGFFALAIAWLACTTTGLVLAWRRDIAGHQRWMIRSFALTLAAISVRALIGIASVNGMEFDDFYPVIAWISWVPNLLIAEWWLRHRVPEPGRRAATAASSRSASRPAPRAGR